METGVMDVTFETKCWENDYRLLLSTNHLERMIENCNYDFKYKQLIINNVNDEKKIASMTKECIEKGIINEVFFASEYASRVLECYDIDVDSFEGGYYYSIAELVGIYQCKTPYLLHFSSDSYIPHRYKASNWIQEAIEIMEQNKDIIVANPTWNYKWREAESESTDSVNEKFWFSQGFSDQCYLINVENFKGKIYNYQHPASARYPKYGGNLFEKRVDSFMRTHDKYRIVAKDVSYYSKNVTKWQIFLEKMRIKKI
jgi:hypothetical protein